MTETWMQMEGEIRQCTLCRDHLPLEPRPVFAGSATARVQIIGQAPGRRAHESGIPFSDASGRRLRQWLGLDDTAFYDATRIAITPMGFCYPGKTASGDKLPPPICARTWHARLQSAMPQVALMLLIGGSAQRAYLPDFSHVTASVSGWLKSQGPLIPMPHPSWHNNRWLTVNPWFENEMLPQVRDRIAALI